MSDIMMALDVLWKGMLAIFIVMAVVFLFVFIMNRIDSYIKKKKKDKPGA